MLGTHNGYWGQHRNCSLGLLQMDWHYFIIVVAGLCLGDESEFILGTKDIVIKSKRVEISYNCIGIESKTTS